MRLISWRARAFGHAAIILAGVVVAVVVAVFPVYWMLVTAMQSGADLFKWPPNFLPDPEEVEVFERVFTERPGRSLDFEQLHRRRRGLSPVACCSPSRPPMRSPASALPASGPSAFILIFTQMVPTVLLMVPLLSFSATSGILNTLTGLVLANTAFVTPITIWILKGYYDFDPGRA